MFVLFFPFLFFTWYTEKSRQDGLTIDRSGCIFAEVPVTQYRSPTLDFHYTIFEMSLGDFFST